MRKIVSGISVLVIAAVFLILAASNILAYGFEKSWPELAGVTIAAIAYVLILRLLGRLCFCWLKDQRYRRIASFAVQYAVSIALYCKLFDLILLPEFAEHVSLLSSLFTLLALHAFWCFFWLVFEFVEIHIQR